MPKPKKAGGSSGKKRPHPSGGKGGGAKKQRKRPIEDEQHLGDGNANVDANTNGEDAARAAPAPVLPSSRLIVKNLGPSIDDRRLKQHFEAFGEVRAVGRSSPPPHTHTLCLTACEAAGSLHPPYRPPQPPSTPPP